MPEAVSKPGYKDRNYGCRHEDRNRVDLGGGGCITELFDNG